MKLKYFLAIAGFAMAISSCDEGTDNIGMSLISSNDDISVTTQEFDVVTASYIPDSVYTYNNELYVGHVTDPETNATVDCSFMMQFNMMEETHLPDKEYIISREDNEIIADSCLVILFFNYCYGDSTTAMKIRISELDHPVADGIHYSNFDPVKGGYIRKGGLSQSHMFTIDDMTVKDSIKNLSTYDRNVMFRLNSPYTDKNGVRYKNYGTYILRNYYEHPDYFKNSGPPEANHRGKRNTPSARRSARMDHAREKLHICSLCSLIRRSAPASPRGSQGTGRPCVRFFRYASLNPRPRRAVCLPLGEGVSRRLPQGG